MVFWFYKDGFVFEVLLWDGCLVVISCVPVALGVTEYGLDAEVG